MKLEQLRKALEKILKRMEELSGAIVGQDGKVRSFTAEEDKEYKDLEVECARTKEAIRRVEAEIEARKEAERLNASASIAPVIEVVREADHNAEGEYRGFKTFGDYLQAVARSSMPGRGVDTRLDALQRSILKRAASGANEGTGSEGGFLVQTDFQQTLWKKTHDQAVLAPLCENVEISSNSNAVEWNEVVEDSRATGYRNGGVRVYRDKEAGTVASSKMETRRDKLIAEKLTAIYYATEELLEDAAALQSMVEPAFAEEMAFTLDDEILFGNGNGECQGVIGCPALITVSKESGPQTAATIVHANVRKMHARIWAPSEARARWFIGSGVQEQLEIMTFTPAGGTSIPVYMPANGIVERGFGQLYGAPVRRIEQCKVVGTLGDILYADFSQYRLVRKGGLKGAMSQHVRFIYGENTFRWTMRVNGKPMWKKPLSPAKGSQTESPFVTLEAR